MKKILIILIAVFLFFNTAIAGIMPPGIIMDDFLVNENNIKYSNGSTKIGNNKLKYNFGFNNTIYDNNTFYQINLDFESNFNGILEIYNGNINYKNDISLEKTINISGKSINIIEYKNSYKNLFFKLINNKGNQVTINDIRFAYENSLYIGPNNKYIKNTIFINYFPKDIILLNNFEYIYIYG